MVRSEELKKIIALCDFVVSSDETKTDWTTDFALFGYALCKLDAYLKEDRYYMFLKSFCDRHIKEKPYLDNIDCAAPSLVVYEMYKRTGNDEYLSLVKSVLSFLERQSKTSGDAVNRFKGSMLRAYYTENLIPCAYLSYIRAKDLNDEDALRQAIRLPKIYADYLMDKKDDLFGHSYWPDAKIRLPFGRNYTGRDNALALFALTLIAEGEDYIHKDINGLIIRLTTSFFKYRNVDGSYNWLFKNKRRSETTGFITGGKSVYLGSGSPKSEEIGGIETSNLPITHSEGRAPKDAAIAAYYAACCLKNSAAGIIDEGYAQAGKDAFLNALNSLVNESGAIYLPDVSRKVFLQNIMPNLFSKINAKTRNSLYGAAGLVFAALEYDKRSGL
ncbi:MAG: hypothetical protein LBT30_05295 [Clostridiales bacterium]|jgi:hypothetical protein|nr:hypothetical protein [Clostridiales bacterium]